MQAKHRQHTKPAGHDITDEHGAVIKAGCGEVFLAAFGAVEVHVERLFERKRAGLEHLAPPAAWAFHGQHAADERLFF